MKRTLASCCVVMALAVILGAFGSHGLEDRVTDPYLQIWKTGNFYHFVHGLAALIIAHALEALGGKRILLITNLFLIGILLFSGSLYLIALWEVFEVPELRKFGAVAPIGGTVFIAAWLLAAYEFMQLYRADKSGTSLD